jgi:hypothetical protein
MPDRFNRNPFDQPYLTEGISTPSELLAYYSFQPFNCVRREVASPGNVFLLGRKGVGKTMILKVFDADLLSEIYRQERSYEEQRPQLPKATVGLYINLASAFLRVREFAGRQRSVEWWHNAFGDFLNYTFLQVLLKNLSMLTSIPGWCQASDWRIDKLEDRPDIMGDMLAALRDESGVFDSVLDCDGLQAALRARLRDWARFLNRQDGADAPSNPLALGLPLFRVAEVLRRYQPSLRILLLVDQYETLHSYKAPVDLRPVFNQAMYEAARGGTGVEFKIGCRPYAFGDLKLPGANAAIERGREIAFVDLDRRADGYFPDFVAELFAKRLQQVAGRPLADPKVVSRQYVPALSAPDEAQRYVQHARTDPVRHLTAYTDWWQRHGLTKSAVQSVVDEIPLTDCPPLVAVLTAIALTRWLGGKSAQRPFAIQPPALATRERKDLLVHYGRGIRSALENRYALGSQKSRQAMATTRAADDFVGDCEAAALFRIASAYKNQRKFFSGFDTIARVSSNVAVVFIDIMKTAWDLVLLREDATPLGPIPPEIQSEAVYTVSESWYARIAREYENGQRQEGFLRGLGSGFRRLQMDLTVRVPAPNGFSVGSGGSESTIRATEDPSELLRELVAWGLLEEAEHQDKSPGRPKRRKYYLNRILCPYFGITEGHHKDPFYVRNISVFTTALLQARLPDEMLTTQSDDNAQPALF